MEVRDCVVKLLCRVIRKHSLEIAKSRPTVIKILRAFHLFQTQRSLYKQEYSLEIVTVILIITCALHSVYHIQGLPGRIAALGQDALS